MSSSAFPTTSRYQHHKIMNHCKGNKIPIRTIIIRNLEEKITETDLTIYFEIFGKITNLSIKKKRLISNHKCALITYKRTEEAAIALRIKRHTLKGVKLQVAAICRQSLISETVKSQPTDTSISKSSFPNYSLLLLNDYCLLHVLSFLNLPDLGMVSGLCSRLHGIAEILFRKVKSVNFNEIGLGTILEASNIVQEISGNVEHFVIRFGGRPRILYEYSAKFFPPLCSNLKSLEIVDIKLKRNTYKSLMPVFRDLESLTLKHCRVTNTIFDLLKTCVKLKKLDLSDNKRIYGKGLFTLPNTIIELNLSDCYNIKQSNFLDLLKVANFKILNINGCYELCRVAVHLCQVESLEAIHMYTYVIIPLLDNRFFEELVIKKSDTLQKLCLSDHSLNDYQKYAVCNFSNLKYLCISYAADDRWLNQLPNSLTYLSIMHTHSISVDAIIKFVERSPNIQTIDISYCKQFSSSIVFKLLEILEILQRPTKFKLVIEGTKIRFSLKNEPLYRKLNHLFELSFLRDIRDCNHELWSLR